jgi:hypothetical protein
MQLTVEKTAMAASATPANASNGSINTLQISAPQPGERQPIERLTILVLKSNETYEVTKYQRDGDLLMFQDVEGRKGGVDVNEVDWRKTSEMTAAAWSGDKQLLRRQTN